MSRWSVVGSLQLSPPFVDLLAALHDASFPDRAYFRIDGHWNPRGHRVAADDILQSLVNFHLLGKSA